MGVPPQSMLHRNVYTHGSTRVSDRANMEPTVTRTGVEPTVTRIHIEPTVTRTDIEPTVTRALYIKPITVTRLFCTQSPSV